MTALLHNPHGTAFGLMDEVYGPGTAQALRDSGGPWEAFDGSNWLLTFNPAFTSLCAYRLKPQPPKPREFWVNYERDIIMLYVPDEDGSFKEGGYIHAREVIE